MLCSFVHTSAGQLRSKVRACHLSTRHVLQVVEAQQQKARLAKKGQQPKAFPRVALDLATTVERIQQNFVISDPSIPDCPIVFASEGFLEMVGYPRSEVLGRNCRILQVRNTAVR